MQIFQNAYFLQSVGWSIVNSFWQAALLWLLYQFLVKCDKNLSSLVKHHFSVTLMVISFTWFVYTMIENYVLLLKNPPLEIAVLPTNFVYQFQQFNAILPCLSTLYFVLLFLYSIQFIKKLIANHLLQNNGLSKPIFDIRRFISHTAKHLGIKKKIHVWISSYVDVPSVTGFFKPIILLPAAFVNDLSVKQVEAILLHELAHIKRNDYIVNLFQSVIETVMFFNPFILLIGKIARKERENCCDDWVLNYQYDQYDYANALLQIEETRNFKQAFVVGATNNKRMLLQRIKRLFNPSLQSPNIKNKDRFKFFSLSLVLFFGIFTTIPELTIKNKVKRINSTIPVVDKIALLPPDLWKASRNRLETTGENVIKTEPVLTTSSKKRKTSGPVVKNMEMDVKPGTRTYTNAYINEELLPGNSNIETSVSLVTDKETNEKKYYIKIEEQVSGNSQTNIYYLELNNLNGETNIKPLIVLEKLNISTRKMKTRKATDTTDSTLIKTLKKRITS